MNESGQTLILGMYAKCQQCQTLSINQSKYAKQWIRAGKYRIRFRDFLYFKKKFSAFPSINSIYRGNFVYRHKGYTSSYCQLSYNPDIYLRVCKFSNADTTRDKDKVVQDSIS